MWWYDKRRTFLFGVIVLVIELIGFQQGLVYGSLLARNAEPSSPYARTWSINGGVQTLDRRFKREQMLDGTGGGKVVVAEGGTSKSVVAASTSPPGGKGSGSQAGNFSNTATSAAAIVKPVKEKTLVIPDRSPANLTIAQMKEENISEEEDDDDGANKRPGQGNFDEKAVQRAVIVVTGIAVIVVIYLGIKFVLIKRRKVVKRYGRVEASEMDLLDEVEDEESEEEEELFDINQQRRS